MLAGHFADLTGKEEKLVVRTLVLLITLLSINSGYAKSSKLEIFYDGFWTHHWAPKSLNNLIDNSRLYMRINRADVPEHILELLTQGYQSGTKVSITDHIVFIRLDDEIGKIEIYGDNKYLYLNGSSTKRLTEKEKIFLNNFIKDKSSKESDFISYRKYKKTDENQ
jgi:hypothetical protein